MTFPGLKIRHMHSFNFEVPGGGPKALIRVCCVVWVLSNVFVRPGLRGYLLQLGLLK